MKPTEDEYSDEIDEFDEEDTFPDLDEDDYDVDEDVSRTYESEYKSGLEKFLEDPWPAATLVLTIIGLIIVLFTPVELWFEWNWTIVGNYGLVILCTAGTVFGLKIWKDAGGSNLRFGGITNVVLILACAVLGTLDTLFWILFGTSFFPGFEGSILALCGTIVVFCLYTLWLIQRSLTQEERK